MLQGQIRFDHYYLPPKTLPPGVDRTLPQTTGEEEAEQKLAKKTEQDKQKLDSMVDKASQILFSLSAVFPFDFFPDQITIDINKVNIIYNYFFLSRHIHSVYVKDISDVVVETGPFFAVLKLIDYGYTENSINIQFLKKSEAIKARRIIQGLIVAHKEGIDLTQFSSAEVMAKMEELGRTHRS